MRYCFALCLFLGLQWGQVATAETRSSPGLLRGYDDIVTYLDGRVFLNPTAEIAIKSCLANDPSLLSMIMVRPGNRDGYASPNPLNANIWLSVMSCMSRRVTPGICANDVNALKVKPKLVPVLAAFCKPNASGQDVPQNLEQLWDQVVGFDADDSVKHMFSAKAASLATHPKALDLILITLLMNPYVLLNP